MNDSSLPTKSVLEPTQSNQDTNTVTDTVINDSSISSNNKMEVYSAIFMIKHGLDLLVQYGTIDSQIRNDIMNILNKYKD